MMPADPVLSRLLDDVAFANEALRSYLTRDPESDLIPLKIAADLWHITDGAALMRVRRDPMLGIKRFGRWFVRRSALAC